MTSTTITPPTNVVERNILLTGEVMQYFFEHPQVCKTLPENFQIVILPDDDAELRGYNLELLDQFGKNGAPIVFVRMHVAAEQMVYQHRCVHVYAPVVA